MKQLKQVFSISILGLLLVLSLCACGNVSNVNEDIGKSTLYTEKEIESAMNVVKRHFSANFNGCKLTNLWYDEEYSSAQAENWAQQYDAKEAIVLQSNFYVGKNGGDGSLNQDSTYGNWNWVLVRSGRNWELKTWGY